MDKKLIIIAEDELAYGKILKKTIEKVGYDVEVALNGDELLKIARRRKSELIILDLFMPIKNGFEVIAELKKDKELKNIKIIALSNSGQGQDIEKVKMLGVDDYIVKSDIALNEVVNKIKKLIK